MDLIPAVPPPTLKQLTASPKQIGSALQGHGPNLSAAQLSPAFAQSMETDQQKYSEVVLEPKISRPRPGTVLHKAVGTLMKKVIHCSVLSLAAAAVNMIVYVPGKLHLYFCSMCCAN